MLVAAGLALFGCAQIETAPEVGEQDLQNAIAVAFSRAQGAADPFATSIQADGGAGPVEAYYRARGYAPLWTGPKGLGRRGALLLDRLSGAGRDALDPGSYAVAAIRAAIAAGDAGGFAGADILLSRGLVRYAADLHGREAQDTGVLAQAADADDFAAWLDGLAPADPNYRRLRSALADYRAIAAAGGWPSVPPGPTLEQGDADLRVPTLRRRLAVTGDLAGGLADGSPFYDAAVAEAVRRFQGRHGLDPDGRTGPRTLAALNRSVGARIGEIEESMADLRDPEFGVGERGILVNIAAAQVTLVEDGEPVLTSRVIIGRPDWPTPTLRSRVTAIVINPPWVVPVSIAVREIVPKVRTLGEEYLLRQGIRLIGEGNRELDPSAVDWSAVGRTGMPFVLRQDPGPLNPLGRVKFQFDNRYSVYLHDTPSRRLFERSERTLSHGCVRVEAAQRLALHLLRQEGWTEAQFERAMERGATKRVELTRPLPVHLVSLSAWKDESGAVHFHDDPYAPPGTVELAMAEYSCPADVGALRDFKAKF